MRSPAYQECEDEATPLSSLSGIFGTSLLTVLPLSPCTLGRIIPAMANLTQADVARQLGIARSTPYSSARIARNSAKNANARNMCASFSLSGTSGEIFNDKRVWVFLRVCLSHLSLPLTH